MSSNYQSKIGLFSISRLTSGGLPVIVRQLHNISPPKGTTNSDCMGNFTIIVGILYQLDPGQISIIIEILYSLCPKM
jgi:hypothetical protein